MRPLTFPSWPHFEADEIEAVSKVMESGKVNYWTGEECHKFEDEFASFVGVKHAISLGNGTLALELGLRAMGIGPGDDVIVPARTFIASASCAVAVGARPVVADIDPISQNLTADTIRAVLTPNTRAIVVVHLTGWPCDMDPINELAQERGIKIIEDCAQAHGAMYKGHHVGSLGECAAFSFCQDKIMTTGGEGGMLLTNDTQLWDKAWSYKDHGKKPDSFPSQAPLSGFRWLHGSFGSNFRMTEIQAAIGRRQLTKLPQWREARRFNAGMLEEGFAAIPGLRITPTPSDICHAYYKYYVFTDPTVLADGWSSTKIIQAINALGIPCFSGACPEIYLEQAFVDQCWGPPERLPVARVLGETSLMFMVHPTLSSGEMLATIKAVSQVMRMAVK